MYAVTCCLIVPIICNIPWLITDDGNTGNPNQSVLGKGLYECDQDSYFDTIVRSIEGQQESNPCNSFKIRKRDEMVYGLKRGRYIPLNSYGFSALLDSNGMFC